MGLSWGQLIGASSIKKYCNKIIDAANEAKKAANDTAWTTANLQNAISDLKKSDTFKVNGQTYEKNLSTIRSDLNAELDALISLCNEIKNAATNKRNNEESNYYAEQRQQQNSN